MPLSDDPAHRAAVIRWAMTRPDLLLAARLAELTDEDLAAELGADPARVWRLRLALRPHAAAWEYDVARLAAAIGSDAPALDALLRRLGLGP